MTPRMRRIRRNPLLRDVFRENRIDAENLVQPVFVDARIEKPREITSIPGMKALPIAGLRSHAEELESHGVKAIMLFGIPESKDPAGSGATDDEGVVQRSLRTLADVTEMALIADVCLCEYTDHGHCGIMGDDGLDDDATSNSLAIAASSLAAAGAHMVCPSGMTDGRVASIRQGLDASGHKDIPIMSYSAKYHSAFYGPFRDALESAPSKGDRSSYQMDVGNRREALRCIAQDIDEGADVVMVKPAITSLDIISDAKRSFNVPIAAYQVSGEYAMVKSAASSVLIDGDRALEECLTTIRRAGADMIISYHTKDFVRNRRG